MRRCFCSVVTSFACTIKCLKSSSLMAGFTVTGILQSFLAGIQGWIPWVNIDFRAYVSDPEIDGFLSGRLESLPALPVDNHPSRCGFCQIPALIYHPSHSEEIFEHKQGGVSISRSRASIVMQKTEIRNFVLEPKKRHRSQIQVSGCGFALNLPRPLQESSLPCRRTVKQHSASGFWVSRLGIKNGVCAILCVLSLWNPSMNEREPRKEMQGIVTLTELVSDSGSHTNVVWHCERENVKHQNLAGTQHVSLYIPNWLTKIGKMFDPSFSLQRTFDLQSKNLQNTFCTFVSSFKEAVFVLCPAGEAIDCFECYSLEGNHRDCEDEFGPHNKTAHLVTRNCKVGYLRFKANYCVKIKGIKGNVGGVWKNHEVFTSKRGLRRIHSRPENWKSDPWDLKSQCC